MARRQLMLTFPSDLVREPLIYNLGQQCKVVTNIRRADVSENRGWVILELDGDEKDLEESVLWLTSKGVRTDPVVGDIVEG